MPDKPRPDRLPASGFNLPGGGFTLPTAMHLPGVFFNLPGAPDEEPQTIEAEHAELVEKLNSYLGRKDARLQEIVQFGYFVPIVFISQAQADAFLAATGWQEAIEHNEHGFYLNGDILAERLGIALPEPLYDFKAGRIDPAMLNVGIQGKEKP